MGNMIWVSQIGIDNLQYYEQYLIAYISCGFISYLQILNNFLKHVIKILTFQTSFKLYTYRHLQQSIILYQLIRFASKMTNILTSNSINPLMNLFNQRQPPPLPHKKTNKKIKPNDENLTDPLRQILSWRDQIKPQLLPKEGSYKRFEQQDITKINPEKWGTNLQGIFINIDWEKTSFQSLKEMIFSNEVLSNGMIFIWGAKTKIGDIMDYLDSMGYAYAQNFTFVLLSRSKIPTQSAKSLSGSKSLMSFFSKRQQNMPESKTSLKQQKIKIDNDYQTGRVKDPSQIFLDGQSSYFGQSQKVLYMFRKINKKEPLELRHQRTSDVYFTIGEGLNLDWKSKEIVYRMIETLLINANYKQKQQLRLLQLWGQNDYIRKGWITVSQTPKTTEVQTQNL